MLKSLQSLNNLYFTNPGKLIFEENGIAISVMDFAESAMSYIEKHKDESKTIGIFANNGLAWATAEVGLSATNCTLVPLPRFFPDTLLSKIIKDSQIDVIYCDQENINRVSNLFHNTQLFLTHSVSNWKLPEDIFHKRIIYTSGTTGTPKGVIQTEKQMNIVMQSLVDVFSINCCDKYYSLLPISTLLEQIASIHCVLLSESFTIFDPVVSNNIFNLNKDFVANILAKQATLLCLTPALLDAFLRSYEANQYKTDVPFKAITVGGAKTPMALLEKGRVLQLPIFEGYGLSESCSVVAVNNHYAHQLGSVGKVLPGIDCSIENGEIVISGDTLMDGYQGKTNTHHKIYTGDLGELDDQGFLRVIGRKDEVIALQNGRNINPSWIEDLVMQTLQTEEVFVFENQEKEFCIAVQMGATFNETQIIELLQKTLPTYCKPEKIYFIQASNYSKHHFMNSSGKIDTMKLQQFLHNQHNTSIQKGY